MSLFAAFVKGFTESAISKLGGSSRISNAESNVRGIFSNKRLQYFIHESTSNFLAVIRTSSKAETPVTDSEWLYMKYKSSINAASSAILQKFSHSYFHK